jgi:hypothetical protein
MSIRVRPGSAAPASAWIFLACGIWMVGLGAYFVLLRPPLLPEDPRFMGSTLPQIRAALPGLERWLNQVFNVMGGFMAGSGVLTAYLAFTAVPARTRGAGIVLALAGLATVATMSWVNFTIDSSFKWLLLVPALLWLAGLAAYSLERGK